MLPNAEVRFVRGRLRFGNSGTLPPGLLLLIFRPKASREDTSCRCSRVQANPVGQIRHGLYRTRAERLAC